MAGRGGEIKTNGVTGVSTGYPSLDAILPGRGWPKNALAEMIAPRWGIGELQLLLPLMKSLTQQKQWILLISTPYIPYAPALVRAGVDIHYIVMVDPALSNKDVLWSIEKALQTESCALVLAWPKSLQSGVVRRLQLAAATGQTLGILFRNRDTKDMPTSLRLELTPTLEGLHVRILKARGTSCYHSVQIYLPCH